jgi:hypothetical protein
MPISFVNIAHDKNWSGSSWVIIDDDKLAELIARVALGQSRYVNRVLAATGFSPIKGNSFALKGAIELLTAADPLQPWHRDGWMFQVISWIASHMQGLGDAIAEPHTIHAHKGFDGVHVKIDPATKMVSLVVICEEKATDHSRKMVRDSVWPEFKKLQAGDRVNELTAQVTQLLEKCNGIDVDAAIEKIIWLDAQAYRVSVTIDDTHNTLKGYEKLFSGYNDIVPGGVERRRAEVLYLNDMRAWMDSLSKKAISLAKNMVA